MIRQSIICHGDISLICLWNKNYTYIDQDRQEEYLETSSEAQLFIRGWHADGKTALIITAAEQSPEMVSLLLEHGAEINTVDSYGWSLLMEAALFGRIDNVEVFPRTRCRQKFPG
jgi:uroporphyrinogen-III synthase